MHAARPRAPREVERRPRGPVARAEVLQEVAAAALAQDVGVVGGRADGDRFGRGAVVVAEVVRERLELAATEADFVVQDDVVGWFRLGVEGFQWGFEI